MRRLPDGMTPPPVRLGLGQRVIINLFTFCDGVNALTGRRWHRDRPYAYAPYLARTGAIGFCQQMRVIWWAKQVKTAKLIQVRRRHGRVPARFVRLCRKTPCGVLRLWAAWLH